MTNAEPTRFTELPVLAETADVQLQTAAPTPELSWDVSRLYGSFSTKRVKDTRQWYSDFREADKRVYQIYVEPDSDAIRS